MVLNNVIVSVSNQVTRSLVRVSRADLAECVRMFAGLLTEGWWSLLISAYLSDSADFISDVSKGLYAPTFHFVFIRLIHIHLYDAFNNEN
jgi:hypothetical protein